MADLEFHAVTPERWDDLVALFEHHGNPGYCWCTRWRLPSAQFRQLTSIGRRSHLESLVRARIPVGVLGYRAGKPVGWCSVAPRETYVALERSTTLPRIDDLPTWSVACFFVARPERGRGLSVELLRAATGYAASEGAVIVEGYPVEPDRSYRFMGSPSVFAAAGFWEVAVTRAGRRIVRYFVRMQDTSGSTLKP